MAALALPAGRALALFFAGASTLALGIRHISPRLATDSTAVRVLRGLLVALPLLVVFVALFSAADAVFSAHLRSAFRLDLDLGDLLRRLTFSAAAAWLFAGTVVIGWARAERLASRSAADRAAPATERRPLAGLEGIVVLLALDLLFALFVVIQAAYLFGGHDTLQVSGLTYADYARRGFFELLAVGFLAGAVLLVIDRLIAARGWAYRAASVALAVLTGVVLVSAVVRLGLYQQAYGWTELRLFALAAIGWLGLGIVATAVALLTDRAAAVPKALVGLALAVAALVNLVGPQSFVATQNLQRAIDPSLVPAGGRSGIDFDYLDRLGDDAVPAVVAALPQLPEQHRLDAEELLRRQAAALAGEARELGWPSWNLARHHAIEALLASDFLVRGGQCATIRACAAGRRKAAVRPPRPPGRGAPRPSTQRAPGCPASRRRRPPRPDRCAA